MNIIDIVNKKNSNTELSYDELKYVVDNYVKGNINDSDMTLFLKAVCMYSMTDEETFNFTDIILKSGKVFDLSSISGIKIDKHSTGGIGDKTTLIVGPIVAASGVVFPKMSGRSLGYTGGTIDKLESIPGFKVNLSEEEFISNLKKSNICIMSQNENIVPADKKIYQLRDVTNTVESIPLIAASIMSKKIACNADKILIDVKYGSGALMKTIDDAIKLAKILVKIGKRYNKETRCIITNMNYPLGNMIGNSLEIKEALEILNNKGNSNLRELCLYLSSQIINMSLDVEIDAARSLAISSLSNNKAYEKFLELINNQGGDLSKIEVSPNILELKSDRTGYINNIDALIIGKAVMSLGAGRINKEDTINHSVGIELKKHVGDYVTTGDVLANIYIDKEVDINILSAYKIENTFTKSKLIEYIVK